MVNNLVSCASSHASSSATTSACEAVEGRAHASHSHHRSIRGDAQVITDDKGKEDDLVRRIPGRNRRLHAEAADERAGVERQRAREARLQPWHRDNVKGEADASAEGRGVAGVEVTVICKLQHDPVTYAAGASVPLELTPDEGPTRYVEISDNRSTCGSDEEP